MEKLSAEEEVTKAFEKLYSARANRSETATKVIRRLPQDGQADRMKPEGVRCRTSDGTNSNPVVHTETDDNQVKGETHRNGRDPELAVPSALDVTLNEEGCCALSFSQVLHYVQSGREIPGIRDLNITPTNQSLTVSQMARKLKPWEAA